MLNVLHNTRPLTVIVILAVAAAVATGYFMLGPESGVYPRCLFLQLTGWQCPGCGSQRAIHALLHGHFAEAWGYNALLFIELPLVALLLAARQLRHRYPQLNNSLNSRLLILIILVTIIGWTIYRNYYGS